MKFLLATALIVGIIIPALPSSSALEIGSLFGFTENNLNVPTSDEMTKKLGLDPSQVVGTDSTPPPDLAAVTPFETPGFAPVPPPAVLALPSLPPIFAPVLPPVEAPFFAPVLPTVEAPVSAPVTAPIPFSPVPFFLPPITDHPTDPFPAPVTPFAACPLPPTPAPSAAPTGDDGIHVHLFWR